MRQIASLKRRKLYASPKQSILQTIRLFCRTNTSTLFFILMLMCGFLLRLYPLLTKSYIQDEMATLAFAQADYTILDHFLRPLDDRPWFYYLFIKGLYAIYPNTIFLRIISLCIGLTSVIVVYIALKKINIDIALLTVFLLLFSLSRIDYSWQIRDMSLLLLATSFLLLFGISLLQYFRKAGTWKRKHIILLSLPIIIGCLTNYIFIVFSISYIIFLCISLFYFSRRIRTILVFLFHITLSLLPLILLLVWYLFGQADTADILVSTRWIPKATVFTILSINSTLLGLTAYFDEFYQPTPDAFNQVLALNIGIVLFFVGTGIALFKKKFIATSPLLRIYFCGGICIHIFSFLLVLGISHILHTNLILHRTFIRSGTLMLLSFVIGIYIWTKAIIRKKYQQLAIVRLAIVYLLLFIINFLSYYKIYDIHTLRFTAKGDIINAIERYYEQGDQIIFFPIHYQFLYIPFYYKNNPKYNLSSKLAYLKMREYNLEDPILRKTLSLYSGDIPNTNRFNGKILFIEERTIFSNSPQGLPDENIAYNAFLYEDIKKYCVTDPIWIDESANYIIRACWFQPKYQF